MHTYTHVYSFLGKRLEDDRYTDRHRSKIGRLYPKMLPLHGRIIDYFYLLLELCSIS